MRVRLANTATQVRLLLDEELTLAAGLFIGCFPLLHVKQADKCVELTLKQGRELNRWVSDYHSVNGRYPSSLRAHPHVDDRDLYKGWSSISWSHNDPGVGSAVLNIAMLPLMTMTELELIGHQDGSLVACWPNAITPPRRRELGRKLASSSAQRASAFRH